MTLLPIQAAVDLFSPENMAGYLATAIVSILGFLITWFLLKKLLFKPMIKVADKREEVVQSGLQANLDEKNRLAKLAEDMTKEEEQLRAKYDQMMQQGREQLDQEQMKIMTDAREEADKIIAKAQERAEQIKIQQEQVYKTEVTSMSIELLGKLIKDQEKAKAQEDDVAQLVSALMANERK